MVHPRTGAKVKTRNCKQIKRDHQLSVKLLVISGLSCPMSADMICGIKGFTGMKEHKYGFSVQALITVMRATLFVTLSCI